MVQALNPLTDSRWADLTRTNAAASVFHTSGWLQALRQTYGYEPVSYTTSAREAPLTNSILLCRVNSWLTGERLVSVPFADHCDPLLDAPENARSLFEALRAEARGRCKYVELRPTAALQPESGFREAATYRSHAIDLRPTLDEIRARTHPSTIQRNIGKAQREALTCKEGRSNDLLDAFYDLLVLTRKRHGVPPAPKLWFENLVRCLGDAVKVRVAYVNGRPIGSIMTLEHRSTLIYKYGCSDARFHNLGTMPFLFWRAIEDAKHQGLETFDLGRSDLDNAGLSTFKERLGGTPSTLTYYRYPARGAVTRRTSTGPASRVLSRLPRTVLIALGRALYRHIG